MTELSDALAQKTPYTADQWRVVLNMLGTRATSLWAPAAMYAARQGITLYDAAMQVLDAVERDAPLTTTCTCDCPGDPPDVPHRAWCGDRRYDCGHLCCDERHDPQHDHFLDAGTCPSCAAYLAWTRRGPWRCPGWTEENGCPTYSVRCECPVHNENDPFACGEDEAAGCHFCAHKDLYAPCPKQIPEPSEPFDWWDDEGPTGELEPGWSRKCVYCGAPVTTDPCSGPPCRRPRACCPDCRRDPHAHCSSWPSCTRADYGRPCGVADV